jgi:Mrp family chromosome partitioning ATPase
MKDIIQQAAESYDWVILDTPPVALQPDAALLGAMVEATVFVIAAGVSPAADIERSIDAVGREKIVGVVLNRVEDDPTGDAAYHGYYPAGSPAGNTSVSAPGSVRTGV